MSGGEIMVIGKLILTFGGLLAFAIWELYKLKK
ncbi:hypothetical protein J2T57_000592 [Natronocella acetinitrilica]|uniref:Uncharacterized protein n=1 Tax=Natronocella acetinitrilica TaxID=414046 RepID=A0AAE3G0X9_9GAMM|nr:hypothetical protein [Natronocella acetinitrilica]